MFVEKNYKALGCEDCTGIFQSFFHAILTHRSMFRFAAFWPSNNHPPFSTLLFFHKIGKSQKDTLQLTESLGDVANKAGYCEQSAAYCALH